MKRNASFLLLLLLAFTSCVSAYQMKSVRVEMMKPSIFPHLENINTIALFSRDLVHLDTAAFVYYSKNHPIKDTAFHNIDNYNACINALTQMIVDAHYFKRVINCQDHFNESIRTSDSSMYNALFQFLHADALVFLDQYKLNDFQWNKEDKMAKVIKLLFSEFGNCTDLAQNRASLIWRLRIKGDTISYIYRQQEELYYGDSIYPQFFGTHEKHQLMLANTATFFARQLTEKLLPSWQQEERLIYVSRDTAMQRAAKYCTEGEWLKAAEIYKRLSKSNKHSTSDCATFNMAFICEMEGDLGAALDWLKCSSKGVNLIHNGNCAYYLDMLETRQNEMLLLNEQLKDKRQYNGLSAGP